MKYAHYENEKLLGYYDDDIHSDIPEPFIEITDSEWSEALSIGANRVINGALVYVNDDLRTPEEIYKEDALQKVQAMLDTEAQSRGYDNINSIGKYLGYDNPFRAECEALGAWTAACWAKCYEIEAEGRMPENILSEMPELVL